MNTYPAGSYIVSPGRTVYSGNGKAGPGSVVTLMPEEAARLVALGYVYDANAPAAWAPTSPGINGQVSIGYGATANVLNPAIAKDGQT